MCGFTVQFQLPAVNHGLKALNTIRYFERETTFYSLNFIKYFVTVVLFHYFMFYFIIAVNFLQCLIYKLNFIIGVFRQIVFLGASAIHSFRHPWEIGTYPLWIRGAAMQN